MDPKPLTPIGAGTIVIAGVKASNIDDRLKNHKQIILWDNTSGELWYHQDLPSNCKAVFMTRFVSHAAFDRIIGEARKRHITVFNPMGTGIIMRQVKELLNFKEEPKIVESIKTDKGTINLIQKEKETKMLQVKNPGGTDRIRALLDLNKTAPDNFKIIQPILIREGFRYKDNSLKNMIGQELRKKGSKIYARQPSPERQSKVTKVTGVKKVMVGIPQSDLVSILEDAIAGLQLIRDEVKELTGLKDKLDKLKGLLS